MEKSESIAQLADALCKAQQEIGVARKTSINPFYKSTYADFASVWETCRDPLLKNGISVVQATDTDGDSIFVETMLMHTSGEWISGRLKIIPIKQDPQSVGSAITYARRYALSGMVCLATEEDDDANKASNKSLGGQAKDIGETPQSKPEKTVGLATDKQIKRLYAILGAQNKNELIEKTAIKEKYGVVHLAELTQSQIQEIFQALEENKVPEPKEELSDLGLLIDQEFERLDYSEKRRDVLLQSYKDKLIDLYNQLKEQK